MAVKTSPNIPPFVRFCTASVPMVFDNSMSYYECLCALTKFLQDDVINVINNNAQQLEGLLEAFTELKNYVDNYFANLDVQEEINAKLDEMAEGGQLATIIAQFLAAAPVFGYGTIAEMAAATNLNDGCIARVIGNTTATDGDGAYYLIRTVDPSDDPDGVNLVAIGDALVGVRVQDAAINEVKADITALGNEIDYKYNRSDSLSLQNYLIYDMSSSYYSQGSTVDDNGNVYVYTSDTSYNGGSLLVFNKTTETLSSTISTNFYHGNGIAYKGGYIYAAPSTSGRDLLKYNISTGTITTVTAFAGETSYDKCISVADYDENNLIVTLGSSDPYQLATSVAPYVYNPTTGDFSKITLTNSKNYKISQFYAFQSLSYYNGHIYILMSEPNCVLDFLVDGSSADLQKIYQIPRRDILGLTIGEVEQLSHVPNTDTFVLTAHVKENQRVAKRSIKLYYLSFNTELPQLYKTRLLTENQSYFDLCYLDSTATTLYEDGSETYPFKTMTRAIECATHCELYTGNQIMLKSGTYEIGRVNSANAIINLYDENTAVVINNYTQISNSSIQFKLRSGTVIFNAQLDIDDNSVFNTFGGVATFKDTIEASMNSRASIEQAILDYTGTTSQVVARSSAIMNIGISDQSTATGASYLFRLSSNAVLITNSDGTIQTFDMDNIGNAWVMLEAGKHSADS